MKRIMKILNVLVFGMALVPSVSLASLDSGVFSLSLLAKDENSATGFSNNISINPGDVFDFVAIIRNDSNSPLNDVFAKIKMPNELLHQGYIDVNGKNLKRSVKNPVYLGTFLPGERKTISFKAESRNVSFKELVKEVRIDILADGDILSSASIKTTLNPHNFKSFEPDLTVKRMALATASFSVKQWYFWVVAAVFIAIIFLKEFFHLFAPRG